MAGGGTLVGCVGAGAGLENCSRTSKDRSPGQENVVLVQKELISLTIQLVEVVVVFNCDGRSSGLGLGIHGGWN